MKIIKNSYLHTVQDNRWLGKCVNCGCVFTCTDGETTSMPDGRRLKLCPGCNYSVEVKLKKEAMDDRVRALEELTNGIELLHRAIFRMTDEIWRER
jgi:hypothetical protein